jgi:GT2 family glycosyltransferase
MITVVVTTCGRIELLKRTLESFSKFNTAPISEYILVDDSGNKDIHNEIRNLYPNYTLILNPVNRGQSACIDDAYSLVKTPYIFHTEGDWEYYREGFMEKSLAILEGNEKIIQVWLLKPSTDPNVAGLPS